MGICNSTTNITALSPKDIEIGVELNICSTTLDPYREVFIKLLGGLPISANEIKNQYKQNFLKNWIKEIHEVISKESETKDLDIKIVTEIMQNEILLKTIYLLKE